MLLYIVYVHHVICTNGSGNLPVWSVIWCQIGWWNLNYANTCTYDNLSVTIETKLYFISNNTLVLPSGYS